jgi:hypothetical protein
MVEADQMLVIFPTYAASFTGLIPVNIKILPQKILGMCRMLPTIHVGALNGLTQ